jgi:hypothetical protein
VDSPDKQISRAGDRFRLMTGQTCQAPPSNAACIHLSLKMARVAPTSIKLGFMLRTRPKLFRDRTAKRPAPLASQGKSFGGGEPSVIASLNVRRVICLQDPAQESGFPKCWIGVLNYR